MEPTGSFQNFGIFRAPRSRPTPAAFEGATVASSPVDQTWDAPLEEAPPKAPPRTSFTKAQPAPLKGVIENLGGAAPVQVIVAEPEKVGDKFVPPYLGGKPTKGMGKDTIALMLEGNKRQVEENKKAPQVASNAIALAETLKDPSYYLEVAGDVANVFNPWGRAAIGTKLAGTGMSLYGQATGNPGLTAAGDATRTAGTLGSAAVGLWQGGKALKGGYDYLKALMGGKQAAQAGQAATAAQAAATPTTTAPIPPMTGVKIPGVSEYPVPRIEGARKAITVGAKSKVKLPDPMTAEEKQRTAAALKQSLKDIEASKAASQAAQLAQEAEAAQAAIAARATFPGMQAKAVEGSINSAKAIAPEVRLNKALDQAEWKKMLELKSQENIQAVLDRANAAKAAEQLAQSKGAAKVARSSVKAAETDKQKLLTLLKQSLKDIEATKAGGTVTAVVPTVAKKGKM